MDENMIRVLVANARDLIRFSEACTTEHDFQTFFDHMQLTAIKACDAIRDIAHVDQGEAADLFIAMVQDDNTRETFIAQAFVAQPAAVVAIGV